MNHEDNAWDEGDDGSDGLSEEQLEALFWAPPGPEERNLGPGTPPGQEPPDAIEGALLSVRHRHQQAGDVQNCTFEQLLREARQELNFKREEEKRTGKSWVQRLLEARKAERV